MGNKRTPSKQICLRIPVDLYDELADYNSNKHETMTDSCLRLLEVGLKQDTVGLATKQDIEQLLDEHDYTQTLLKCFIYAAIIAVCVVLIVLFLNNWS